MDGVETVFVRKETLASSDLLLLKAASAQVERHSDPAKSAGGNARNACGALAALAK
jgi:hypothetical protein